jgi:hypothetical protein
MRPFPSRLPDDTTTAHKVAHISRPADLLPAPATQRARGGDHSRQPPQAGTAYKHTIPAARQLRQARSRQLRKDPAHTAHRPARTRWQDSHRHDPPPPKIHSHPDRPRGPPDRDDGPLQPGHAPFTPNAPASPGTPTGHPGHPGRSGQHRSPSTRNRQFCVPFRRTPPPANAAPELGGFADGFDITPGARVNAHVLGNGPPGPAALAAGLAGKPGPVPGCPARLARCGSVPRCCARHT